MENMENREGKSEDRYMRRLTLWAVLWTAATTMIYAMLLPAHYVEAYPAIPIFLYVLAVMAHRVVSFFERQGAPNVIMIYLVVKMLKLVLSVIGLLIYCLVATRGVKEFVIAFLVNYVFYLVVETSLLVAYKLKKQ